MQATDRTMATDPQEKRSARDRAVKVLLASYDGRRFCQNLLRDLQEREPLQAADAALATELAIGTSRHRITAEHLAARFYRGRWAGLPQSIRVILALAVYQLCWLDRIPDHAAVDQAVRQARRRGRGPAPLVNSVLRKLAASRGEMVTRPDAPDPRRYLPISVEGGRGRNFAEAVFPDPARRPLDHLIAVTGHPSWLVERWHRRFKAKLCRQICDAGQRRPPLTLRPNPIRTTSEELCARLRDAGDHPVLVDGEAIALRGTPTAGCLAEIEEGLCQPQDVTAQLPLKLASLKPGDCVLDLCAGSGTKSTQAAELLKNDGLVLSTDAEFSKLDRLPDTAERMGLTIIEPTPQDRIEAALARLGRRPDVILLDVPCTNTGVLARRPEARYRATHKALLNLVEVQRELLRVGCTLAGPGSRLVYATCSIEQEENEDQIAWFCEAFPQWRVSTQVCTLPDLDRDGGYAAVLTLA